MDEKCSGREAEEGLFSPSERVFNTVMERVRNNQWLFWYWLGVKDAFNVANGSGIGEQDPSARPVQATTLLEKILKNEIEYPRAPLKILTAKILDEFELWKLVDINERGLPLPDDIVVELAQPRIDDTLHFRDSEKGRLIADYFLPIVKWRFGGYRNGVSLEHIFKPRVAYGDDLDSWELLGVGHSVVLIPHSEFEKDIPFANVVVTEAINGVQRRAFLELGFDDQGRRRTEMLYHIDEGNSESINSIQVPDLIQKWFDRNRLG